MPSARAPGEAVADREMFAGDAVALRQMYMAEFAAGSVVGGDVIAE